jgi:hypothetical protein
VETANEPPKDPSQMVRPKHCVDTKALVYHFVLLATARQFKAFIAAFDANPYAYIATIVGNWVRKDVDATTEYQHVDRD